MICLNDAPVEPEGLAAAMVFAKLVSVEFNDDQLLLQKRLIFSGIEASFCSFSSSQEGKLFGLKKRRPFRCQSVTCALLTEGSRDSQIQNREDSAVFSQRPRTALLTAVAAAHTTLCDGTALPSLNKKVLPEHLLKMPEIHTDDFFNEF